MKKIILTALVAVAALSANAQQWWLGGDFNLNVNKAEKGAKSETTFKFAPEVGIQFNEKWAIGINFTYDNNDEIYDGAKYAGVGFFGRYTIAKTGIATFFVDGGVGFKFYNNSIGTEISAGFRPGVSIAASEKISLVTKVGYLGWQKHPEGGYDIDLGINNSPLSFGVFYNF